MPTPELSGGPSTNGGGVWRARALLFGSYTERCATSAGDVDLIVEFAEPGVALFPLNGLRYDLRERLSLVDVIHGSLNPDATIAPARTISAGLIMAIGQDKY